MSRWPRWLAAPLAFGLSAGLLLACRGELAGRRPPSAWRCSPRARSPTAAGTPAPTQGLEAIRDQLGAEVRHVETRTPAEFEEGFRDFAQRGFALVFGHGFEYQDAAAKVGAEFPGTIFITTSGNTRAPERGADGLRAGAGDLSRGLSRRAHEPDRQARAGRRHRPALDPQHLHRLPRRRAGGAAGRQRARGVHRQLRRHRRRARGGAGAARGGRRRAAAPGERRRARRLPRRLRPRGRGRARLRLRHQPRPERHGARRGAGLGHARHPRRLRRGRAPGPRRPLHRRRRCGSACATASSRWS